MKANVFAAAEALLSEDPNQLPSMAAIAEKAQVNATSLYRRWSDVRALLGAVAVDRLMRDLPIADTGSLRADLIAWGAAVARSLSTRRNVTMLRLMLATPPGTTLEHIRDLPINRRLDELKTVLARGKKRREITPSAMDVLELVLAPIYLHGLFIGPLKDAAVDRLVDRALKLAAT